MASDHRNILIDADVVSHFITAGEEDYLHLIFPDNKIYILDKVHAELQKWPKEATRAKVSDLIGSKKLRLISFPEDHDEMKREYFSIKTLMFKGDGESACLAFVRHTPGILASSNLKDTRHYCEMHKIDYLTTIDFLCAALARGVFDAARCNKFIKTVLSHRGRLPAIDFANHQCRDTSFTNA